MHPGFERRQILGYLEGKPWAHLICRSGRELAIGNATWGLGWPSGQTGSLAREDRKLPGTRRSRRRTKHTEGFIQGGKTSNLLDSSP